MNTNYKGEVLCGASVNLLAEFAPDCVDLVVTDPPYLVRYRDRCGRTIAHDDDVGPLLDVFEQIYRIMKPNRYGDYPLEITAMHP